MINDNPRHSGILVRNAPNYNREACPRTGFQSVHCFIGDHEVGFPVARVSPVSTLAILADPFPLPSKVSKPSEQREVDASG